MPVQQPVHRLEPERRHADLVRARVTQRERQPRLLVQGPDLGRETLGPDLAKISRIHAAGAEFTRNRGSAARSAGLGTSRESRPIMRQSAGRTVTVMRMSTSSSGREGEHDDSVRQQTQVSRGGRHRRRLLAPRLHRQGRRATRAGKPPGQFGLVAVGSVAGGGHATTPRAIAKVGTVAMQAFGFGVDGVSGHERAGSSTATRSPAAAGARGRMLSNNGGPFRRSAPRPSAWA